MQRTVGLLIKQPLWCTTLRHHHIFLGTTYAKPASLFSGLSISLIECKLYPGENHTIIQVREQFQNLNPCHSI